MRVAALYDVHGNLPALDAVLADVERERPDAIVFGGDVISGPWPRETLRRLMSLEDAHFVMGNADREVVRALQAEAPVVADAEHPARRLALRIAPQLSPDERDFLASFRPTVVLDVQGLGEVLFCHGSPRSDEEVITRLTPEDRLAELLAGIDQDAVVCGHTHMQFDRVVGETRIVNAGSVGMPYEDRPGAFWLALGPGVEHRRTEYDVERTAARIRAEGHDGADDHADILTRRLNPSAVAAFFEGIGPEPEFEA